MKKRILVILLAVVLAMTSVLFVGCQKTETPELCQIKVILGDKTYDVETECRTLHEVLQEMKEDGVIDAYEFSGTQFSPYITKLGTLEDSAADRVYIAVYHNIDDSSLKAYGMDPIEVNGATFYYSAVGVALLPVVDGAQYYFAESTY